MSSLQEQLQAQRAQLQPASTVVTTLTGARYREQQHGSVTELLSERNYGFVVDTRPDTTAACIIDGVLYLGSQDAVTAENIATHHITHILSVGIETPALDAAALTVHCLPCLDLPETQLFGADDSITATAIAYIDAARLQNGRVLVHCNAGVSRSASIVIAYLMQRQRLSFDAAYTLVKTRRPCVQPNAGFMQQLKQHVPQ